MQYKLEIYRDGELINTLYGKEPVTVMKALAECYRDLTKHGYAYRGTLTDKMIDGEHIDIFDLYYDSGLNTYRYHYEFDFSIRR